ncbi:MAG TPA: hypothetical protein VN257_04855 [Actinotalea sp.]|nr:hypothetical protein [Actinotalea sp.]
MSRDQRGRAAVTSAGGVLACALLMAGCTGAPQPALTTPTPAPTTATPTATPTPSVDPATAEAEAAALAAYEGFWAAKVAYLAAPGSPEPSELQQYAVDKALGGVRDVARAYQENGIVSRGEPVLAPEVTAVELEGEPSAVITDCVDVTNWQPVFESTGESAAAPGQLNRQVSETQAIFYDDRWVMRETTIYRDRSC